MSKTFSADMKYVRKIFHKNSTQTNKLAMDRSLYRKKPRRILVFVFTENKQIIKTYYHVSNKKS